MSNYKKAIAKPHIIIREPESIYQIHGEIVNGTFHGRWHFSFGDNYDAEHMQLGTLRVFNDDTLSPGAVWPLHPHSEIEIVTYCAEGEFRHEDQQGKGGVLKKGMGAAYHCGTGHVPFGNQQQIRHADAIHSNVVHSIGNRPGSLL